MPHRSAALITWLWEALKAAAAVAGGLVAVEAFGPHLAALLVTLGEVAVAWIALPKPYLVAEQFGPEERAAYKTARRLLFRKRRRRLGLLVGILFVLVIASNVIPGAGALDTLFSTIYVAAIALQTLNTAQHADDVFTDPISAVRRLLHIKRPPTRPPAEPNGGTSERRGKSHVGS